MDIRKLDMSIKLKNCLLRNCIENVEDLKGIRLLKIHGIGKKSYVELKKALDKINYRRYSL